MSTISQLDLGTEIQVYENENPVPYVLIKKDLQGCVVLRVDGSDVRRMNPTNTSVYENSEADVYLNDSETGFLSRFDADTYSCITARSISTHNYGDTESRSISRRCFLLSYGELFNNSATAVEPEIGTIPALMIFKQTSDLNTARIAQYGGSAIGWWLRSPYPATGFYVVLNSGVINNYNAANTTNALRPALNVLNNATVTVGADNKVYLTPTLSERRAVEFKAKVTEETVRPSKARVTFNSQGLSNLSVKVCNNYGDINPAWVDATSQQEVTIANASKETENWQVGIWFYGDTATSGYVEEPEINYLMEG